MFSKALCGWLFGLGRCSGSLANLIQSLPKPMEDAWIVTCHELVDSISNQLILVDSILIGPVTFPFPTGCGRSTFHEVFIWPIKTAFHQKCNLDITCCCMLFSEHRRCYCIFVKESARESLSVSKNLQYRCSITTYHFQIFDHFLYTCLATRKTHITYPSISRTFFKWSLASGLLRWFCWCNWVFFANPQGSKSWLQQKSFRRDSIAPVTFYLGVSLSLMPKCRNPCTAFTTRNSSTHRPNQKPGEKPSSKSQKLSGTEQALQGKRISVCFHYPNRTNWAPIVFHRRRFHSKPTTKYDRSMSSWSVVSGDFRLDQLMFLFEGDLPRTATRAGVLVGSRQKSYGMPAEVDHGHV